MWSTHIYIIYFVFVLQILYPPAPSHNFTSPSWKLSYSALHLPSSTCSFRAVPKKECPDLSFLKAELAKVPSLLFQAIFSSVLATLVMFLQCINGVSVPVLCVFACFHVHPSEICSQPRLSFNFDYQIQWPLIIFETHLFHWHMICCRFSLPSAPARDT